MKEYRKILIIRLSALGDVAMSLPVVYAVARANPDVRFTFLTRPFFANLAIDPPANLEIATADFKHEHKGRLGMFRLMRQLSARGFDAVADLHNVSRSWVIDAWMRLHGCRVAMVDKMRPMRRRLLAGEIASMPNFRERFDDVFRRLGLKTAKAEPVAIGDNMLPPDFVPAGAVGIAPFARYYNKAYPIDSVEETVRLLSDAGVPVILFGARGQEATLLSSWAEKYPGVTSAAGRFSLVGELAVMSRLALMVSMDSANQHLAALVGCPVLTVWGSTTPACGFEPLDAAQNTNVCLGLPCQPCTIAGSDYCRLGSLACMCGIAPATLADRIMEVNPLCHKH